MSYAFLSFTGASTHSYPTDIRPLHEYVSARFRAPEDVRPLYLPLRTSHEHSTVNRAASQTSSTVQLSLAR